MRYRFGPYTLDQVAGRLLRGDDEVELQPKAMALLATFVRFPGRLFSRRALLDEVWPDVTVSDHSLSQALFKLRQALEAGNPGPQWVQTVRGRGYRFEGQVEVEPITRPSSSPSSSRQAFIGRLAELHHIADLFADGHQAVALVGPGGQGKTRLAREAAARAAFPLAAFVDLVEVRHSSQAVAATAAALGIPLGQGDHVAQLGHALAVRGAQLVVVDNVESVRDGIAPLLTAWRAAAPEVRWLLTSRHRTELDDVVTYEVPGMTDDDAVALFRARAAERAPALGAQWHDTLRAIASCLDAQPLALELAASRIPVLDPAGLLARLKAQARALGHVSDGPLRHHSMKATLQWSWDLLPPQAQQVLAGLAWFRGSFTADQAQAVYGDDPLDLLTLLADHYLVASVPHAPGRLRLPDAVRSFVRRRAEAEPFQARFVAAMRRVAEAPVDHDLPNLLAAIELTDDAPERAALVVAVAPILTYDARAAEAIALLDRVPPSGDLPVALTDQLLLERSRATGLCGGVPELVPPLQAAAEEAMQRGEPAMAARLLDRVSQHANLAGDRGLALQAAQRSVQVASEAGDLEAVALASYRVATAAMYGGDPAIASQAARRGLAALRPHHDLRLRAILTDVAATLEAHDGQGGQSLDEQLRLIQELRWAGRRTHALMLEHNAASNLQEARRFDEALALQDRCYAAARAAGLQHLLGLVLTSRSVTHMHLGQLDHAEADLWEARPHVDGTTAVLVTLNQAAVASLQGDVRRARRRCEAAIDAAAQHGVIEASARGWLVLAALADGDRPAAEQSLERARALRQEGLPSMLEQMLDVVEAACAGRPIWLHGDEHPLAHLAARAAQRAQVAATTEARSGG